MFSLKKVKMMKSPNFSILTVSVPSTRIAVSQEKMKTFISLVLVKTLKTPCRWETNVRVVIVTTENKNQ